MTNYYKNYLFVDSLISLVAKQKNGSFPIKRVSKNYIQQQIPELAEIHGFIEIHYNEKGQILVITNAGREHLQRGGFKVELMIQDDFTSTDISFRVHLEQNTNLLTIFGILNALIIFSKQQAPDTPGKLNLLHSGMEFIGISMYVLSLLVLYVMTWDTIRNGGKSWLFDVLAYCLFCTTLGVGMLFVTEYSKPLAAITILVLFMGSVFLVGLYLFRLVYLLPARATKWMDNHTQLTKFIILTSSFALTALLFKVAKQLFEG